MEDVTIMFALNLSKTLGKNFLESLLCSYFAMLYSNHVSLQPVSLYSNHVVVCHVLGYLF